MGIGLEFPYQRLVAGFVTAVCAYLFFLEPWGHDTWFHVLRLLDVAAQVEGGRYHLHFASNTAQGMGLPVWIYYSQWIYWPPMLLMFLGASPLVALKIVYCGLLIVCTTGCYLLLRVESDKNMAAFGTLLFVTSNYVIGEISQRSAYAEFWSVAFLPLLLLAINWYVLGRKRGAAVAVVLLAALMILAHPLSFMNSGWALAAYAIYLRTRTGVPTRQLAGVVLQLVLALALTAFYWLPAVIETPYVLGAGGVPTPIEETFLDLRRYLNFSGPTNLGPVLTVLVPAVAAYVLIRGDSHEGTGHLSSWPLLAGVLGYVFLTLRISEPLYSNVPLLESNLWVWRVLFQVTLLAVVFVTPRLRVLPSRVLNRRNFAIVAAICVLQAAAFILWNTAGYLSIRAIELSETLSQLENERIRTKGFGVDEYLPSPGLQTRVGSQCRSFRNVQSVGAYELTFQIAPSDADVCIQIARFWNTRYAAWVAGERIPVYADTEGEIVIVPGGRAGVAELRYTRPSYVTIAAWTSAAAGLTLLMLVAASVARRRSPDGGSVAKV
jgi:hypothetical protein